MEFIQENAKIIDFLLANILSGITEGMHEEVIGEPCLRSSTDGIQIQRSCVELNAVFSDGQKTKKYKIAFLSE